MSTAGCVPITKKRLTPEHYWVWSPPPKKRKSKIFHTELAPRLRAFLQQLCQMNGVSAQDKSSRAQQGLLLGIYEFLSCTSPGIWLINSISFSQEIDFPLLPFLPGTLFLKPIQHGLGHTRNFFFIWWALPIPNGERGRWWIVTKEMPFLCNYYQLVCAKAPFLFSIHSLLRYSTIAWSLSHIRNDP